MLWLGFWQVLTCKHWQWQSKIQPPTTCIFESIGIIECWQSLIKKWHWHVTTNSPVLTSHWKCTLQSYYKDLPLINPWKMEVGVQWEGFLLSRVSGRNYPEMYLYTQIVNITVLRTVQLLWISVDIPYRNTSKTWRQQVYVHVAIHRETTLQYTGRQRWDSKTINTGRTEIDQICRWTTKQFQLGWKTKICIWSVTRT